MLPNEFTDVNIIFFVKRYHNFLKNMLAKDYA